MNTEHFMLPDEILPLAKWSNRQNIGWAVRCKGFPKGRTVKGQRGLVYPRAAVTAWLAKHTTLAADEHRSEKRNAAQTAKLLEAAREVLEENGQISCREMFYRLAGKGLIAKTERENIALNRLAQEWRRSGELPYLSMEDPTRVLYGEAVYGYIEEGARTAIEKLRRDVWAAQPVRAELWIEKEAINSTVRETADKWRLDTLVGRGGISIPAIGKAAQRFAYYNVAHYQKVVVLYLGDSDPHGVKFDPAARAELDIAAQRLDLKPLDVEFKRVAITREQITEHGLLTRPTKTKTKNGRRYICGENFVAEHEGSEAGADSVELEAMPTETLCEALEDAILALVDMETWDDELETEASEKAELLARLADDV